MAVQGLERPRTMLAHAQAGDRGLAQWAGFAVRKRTHEMAARAWWKTVTHFVPEPWLIARRAADARRLRRLLHGPR